MPLIRKGSPIELGNPGSDRKLKQALVLVSRLERISVDSYWAHRASGCRVALLRFIDRLEPRQWDMSITETASLDALLKEGFRILKNAAKELRGKSA